jgi:hypothetical protein
VLKPATVVATRAAKILHFLSFIGRDAAPDILGALFDAITQASTELSGNVGAATLNPS